MLSEKLTSFLLFVISLNFSSVSKCHSEERDSLFRSENAPQSPHQEIASASSVSLAMTGEEPPFLQ